VLCRRLVNSYVAANNLQSSVVVLDKAASELTAFDIDYNQVLSVNKRIARLVACLACWAGSKVTDFQSLPGADTVAYS